MHVFSYNNLHGKNDVLIVVANNTIIENDLVNLVTILMKQICHVVVLIKCYFINTLLN